MKKIFLTFFISSLAAGATLAQETEKSVTAVSAPAANRRWSVGLSTLQWNEELRLQSGPTTDKDVANLNAVSLSAQTEFTNKFYGWSLGFFLGSGHASGGGNSSALPYQESRIAFTVMGVHPRLFYRLPGRISAGVTGLVFSKSISWPAGNPSRTVDSGRNLNAMLMLDLNISLSQSWDFYQGLGPLSEGSTLWKLGVSKRF
jgi:hypothetical protein